jgi:hypothetical protein
MASKETRGAHSGVCVCERTMHNIFLKMYIEKAHQISTVCTRVLLPSQSPAVFASAIQYTRDTHA